MGCGHAAAEAPPALARIPRRLAAHRGRHGRGPEATIGEPPGQVRLVAPQGKRAVLRVLQGGYRWEVPAWVCAQRGQAAPARRAVEGALGPVAVVLSGGAVIYSKPEAGPLADASYVLPGSVRASEEDLLAVVENLKDGTPVYFF